MQTIQDQFSWCDVEPEIKQLLLLASENWENTALAAQYIQEALSKAKDNLDVLVGAYRFFFYKHQPTTALSIAQQVLKTIATQENLPTEWSQLKTILLARQQEPNMRLYLNAYAATGLILAQLGKIESAKLVSTRVKEIDRNRESCATTVFEVITRSPDEDDE
ncbi:MAG TPA: hypothetical protein ACFCUY_00450 [Xenococcaceae cyanobacterium]